MSAATRMPLIKPCLILLMQLSLAWTNTQVLGAQTFTSSSGGYVVRYPGSWHQFPPRLPTLSILNFPPSQRVRAVVLPEGGAAISLTLAPAGVSNTEEWYARDVKPGMHSVTRTEIVLARSAGTDALYATEVDFSRGLSG